MSKSYALQASLICGSPLEVGSELKALEEGGMDGIHFDVMDGMFVPRYGLYPEMLAAVKKHCSLPVGVHLMVEEPIRYLKVFAEAGADILVVHAESTRHLHQTLRTIKELGCRAGVALNPATPLSVLDYVLDDIEVVMLMAINPGILGHKLIPSMMEKIAHLKKRIAEHPNIRIEVDGGVSPSSAAHMVRAGADMLVCGTSSVFLKDKNLAESARLFRAHVDEELKQP